MRDEALGAAEASEWLVEPRSFSHPVTNATVLAPVALGREWGEILGGRLPHWLMSSYLHEGTHHQTHHSLLGFGTSLTFFRAERAALKLVLAGNTLDEATLNEMVQDWHRFLAASELVRPLGEGLALFAEFDAYIGDSPTVSDVMEGFKTVAHGHEGQGDASIYDHLNRQLLRMRLLPRTLTRLTDLLVLPLTPERGGYLLGYLAVRQMWTAAARGNERLRDRDLFLGYLRSWIFDDPVLVWLLLNPKVDAGAAVRSAGNYLAGRIREFVAIDHDRNLDKLQRWQLDPENQPRPTAIATGPTRWSGPDFGRDAKASARGHRQLATLYRDLEKTADQKDEIGQRATDQLWTLAQRDMMCIGRADTQIEFRPGRVIANLSNIRVAGPSHSARDSGTANGVAEMFQSLSGKYLATFVRADKEVVLSQIPLELPHEYRDQMLKYRGNTEERNERQALSAGAIRELVGAHLSGDPDSAAIFARLLIGEPLEELALADVVAPGLRQEVMDRMRENGFYSLLGKVSLVRSLAWLHLRKGLELSDLRAEFEADREVHRASGDLQAVADEIASTSTEAIGWPLLMLADGEISWYF